MAGLRNDRPRRIAHERHGVRLWFLFFCRNSRVAAASDMRRGRDNSLSLPQKCFENNAHAMHQKERASATEEKIVAKMFSWMSATGTRC